MRHLLLERSCVLLAFLQIRINDQANNTIAQTRFEKGLSFMKNVIKGFCMQQNS